MKFIHLADLHIGKRVNEMNLHADQRHILTQILDIIDAEAPDGVLIAGDVYDKPMPPAEAVELLDWFLTQLAARGLPCFVVSGNHDSAERIAFGSSIMALQGIHLSPVFDGTLRPVTLHDAHGAVDVYLMPYLKPAMVRAAVAEVEPPRSDPSTSGNSTDASAASRIESWDDAVRVVLSRLKPDASRRSVLVAHQFVTATGEESVRCESESISVGGSDNVDASAFDGFDYVALGHLHQPQRIARDTLRYAGSPLKYSFSESRHRKSATIVELGAKGDVSVRLNPLLPMRDMRELRGPLKEITALEIASQGDAQDYVHVTLTDEEEIIDAIGKVRAVYPNVMKLDFDNLRTRTTGTRTAAEAMEEKSDLELFREFWLLQNGEEIGPEQERIAAELLNKAGGDLT